jgi:putative transposase
MLRTFRYRIYPTRRQERLLEAVLDECRWLYNHLLEQRRNAWEEGQKRLSVFEQTASLPKLKQERPALQHVYGQVLQNVARRVERNFQAFLRRVGAGEQPGYPRFLGRGRYASFSYPQAPRGCKLMEDRLHLAGMGSVRVVLHRPIEGTPKTVTLKRSATGKWYVLFACEWEPTPLPPADEGVGIDVGLAAFATLSSGEKIPNPRFLRQEQKAESKAQRRLTKERKDTPKRRKRRKVVARVHERTTWRRQNFIHQQSRTIVNRYQVIAVEDLSVKWMVRNHCLAKAIADVGWATFLTALRVKAAWAGRSFAAVNPAHTSQDCSRCGHRQRKELSERIHHCQRCGLLLDRDHNSALRILGLGLQSLGLDPGSPQQLPREQPQLVLWNQQSGLDGKVAQSMRDKRDLMHQADGQ